MLTEPCGVGMAQPLNDRLQMKIYTLLLMIPLLMVVNSCGRKITGKSIDDVSVSVLSKEEMRALKKFTNQYHQEEAQNSPVKEVISSKKYFLENQADIEDSYELEKIEDTETFIVSKLTHSIPWVTSYTKSFLELLGERMEDSFASIEVLPYRYVLTSITRTENDQKRLRKSNLNATQNESSHFYGVSIDISQTRFAMPESRKSVYSYRLRNLIARELIKLQEEGHCYVVLENREKCFHITVRK